MNTSKKYLKEIVYGSIDGIITTFAIVSGVIGASLSSGVIIILGLANLFADGISMAIGNYLSTKSEIEKLEEENEVNKSVLDPRRTAFATFAAFVIFGFFPLLSFVVSGITGLFVESSFKISIALTAIALFFVGMTKAKIVHKGLIRGGVETLLIGGLAATVAFLVGYVLKGLVV